MEKAKIDIDYVANLAKVKLTQNEKEKLSIQLNDILVYFEHLNSANLDNIQPMAHAHKVKNVWREGDSAGITLSKNTLEAMAPQMRDGQVVVPKVVD